MKRRLLSSPLSFFCGRDNAGESHARWFINTAARIDNTNRSRLSGGFMSMSNEQLATRFVEILAERASRNGLTVPRWSTLPANWRRVWIETVPAFLEELGYQAIA